MASTAEWADEISTEFQTGSYSSDAMTTSSESSSLVPVSLQPFKAVLIVLGVLGTLSNGFVLLGFWISERSKLASTSIHIVNHTILEHAVSDFCELG